MLTNADVTGGWMWGRMKKSVEKVASTPYCTKLLTKPQRTGHGGHEEERRPYVYIYVYIYIYIYIYIYMGYIRVCLYVFMWARADGINPKGLVVMYYDV